MNKKNSITSDNLVKFREYSRVNLFGKIGGYLPASKLT
jgi:hypothetical protein